MGRMAVVSAGSVLGEQAFILRREAPLGRCLAGGRLRNRGKSPDQYAAFEESSPARARDLFFALGRILAMRLRTTTAKVVG
jgi:hypothetical protein